MDGQAEEQMRIASLCMRDTDQKKTPGDSEMPNCAEKEFIRSIYNTLYLLTSSSWLLLGHWL